MASKTKQGGKQIKHILSGINIPNKAWNSIFMTPVHLYWITVSSGLVAFTQINFSPIIVFKSLLRRYHPSYFVYGVAPKRQDMWYNFIVASIIDSTKVLLQYFWTIQFIQQSRKKNLVYSSCVTEKHGTHFSWECAEICKGGINWVLTKVSLKCLQF